MDLLPIGAKRKITRGAERNDGLGRGKGKLSAEALKEPRKHFFYASTRGMCLAIAFVESLWYLLNIVAYAAAISGLMWDIHMRITQTTYHDKFGQNGPTQDFNYSLLITETALAVTGLILNYFALLSVGGLFVSAYTRGQYNCLVVVYLTKNLFNIAYDGYVIVSCSLVGAELTVTTGTCTDGNYWHLHVTFGILLCLLHGYFSYVAYLFYKDNAKMTAFVSEQYNLYATILHRQAVALKHKKGDKTVQIKTDDSNLERAKRGNRHGSVKQKKRHGHNAKKHGNEKK